MPIDEIIYNLRYMVEMMLFDPMTGETIERHQLNKDNRDALDACKGAIEILKRIRDIPKRADGNGGFTDTRMTEKSLPGCFEYVLKDHAPVVGEFGKYEAFFDYSMAVRRLGELEDCIYGRDAEAKKGWYKAYDQRVQNNADS